MRYTFWCYVSRHGSHLQEVAMRGGGYSMQGWIRLHRQIQDNPLWLNEKFTDGQAWIDMLMLANYSDGMINKRGIRVTVPRGYFGWSEVELGKRWKWSRGKVRRFFQFLIQQNMIEIEQQKFKLTTLIKIVNYPYYQGDNTSDDTTDDTTDEHETDMKRYSKNKNNKNNKNKKEKKEESIINIPEAVKTKLLESVFLTENEIQKLKEKFNGDFDTAIEILDNYKMSSGKKYKSDYHTLIGWVAKRITENKTNLQTGFKGEMAYAERTK